METQEERFARFRSIKPKDAAAELSDIATRTFKAVGAVQSSDDWFCDNSTISVELPAGQWFTVLTALFVIADDDANNYAAPNSGLDYAMIGESIVQACVEAKTSVAAA